MCSVRCSRHPVLRIAPPRPLFLFVPLLLVLCGDIAVAGQSDDAQDRDPYWYVQGGAYAHWVESGDDVGPPVSGAVEHHRSDGCSGGLSLFNNSFRQFTQYVYLGSPRPDRARRSLDPVEALMAAGRLRFRPIVMTALAAILALLPLALGIGQGSSMLQPLAIAIVSGLVLTLPAVLLLLPVLLLVVRAGRRSPPPR